MCLKCKKKSHFASVCKATEQRLSDVSEDLFIDEIRIDSCESDDDVVWMTEVKVNDTMVNFKIDTGAHVNVIPLKVYEKITKRAPLQETKSVLSDYGNHKLKTLGKTEMKCVRGQHVEDVEFYVTDLKSPPVLGLV